MAIIWTIDGRGIRIDCNKIEVDERFLNMPLSIRGGPQYHITKRENHGLGYHAHIEVQKGGKYVRSGYIITLDKNILVASAHGRNPLFNLEKRKNAFLGDVKNYIGNIFKGIPLEEMLTVPKNAIPLTRINH